jgi:hypothetical protein
MKGGDWGRPCNGPGGRARTGTAGHLYVSAAGFSHHFRKRAHKEGGILLLDLEDLSRATDGAPGLNGGPEGR